MLLPAYTHKRLLIDCNSFFASCEVLRNPQLRGKPVCVGNDIILAATYEAKRYGVRTGTPVREAKRILPKDTVFVSPDMRRYGTVSRRVMSFLKERFGCVYVASIDEAFIDLTYEKLSIDNRTLRCKSLKEAIHKEVGVPVSIGLSVTKILAKLCADYHKPLGEYVALTELAVEELLSKVGVQAITFIGSASAEKLAPFCRTGLDMLRLGSDRIKGVLGMHGLKIRYELAGISLHMKKLEGPPKSIGRVRSFNPYFSDDKTTIRRHLLANVEKARRELHDQGLKTRCIKVFLKSKDRQKSFAIKELPEPTDSYEEILQIVQTLFGKARRGLLRRRTGVVFKELSRNGGSQPSLFAPIHTEQQKRLDSVMHQLNQQRGRGTVTRGYITKKDSRTARALWEMIDPIE